MLNGKTILVTGGTGSFGNAFTQYVLDHYTPKKIIIIPAMSISSLLWRTSSENIKTHCGFLSEMSVIKKDCTGRLMEWIMWYTQQH